MELIFFCVAKSSDELDCVDVLLCALGGHVYVKIAVVGTVMCAFLCACPEFPCIYLDRAWFDGHDSVEAW